MDKFYDKGMMGDYIWHRNTAGAGHSTSQVGGHGLFMENISPLNGFNGCFGFRRNTPSLRTHPSVFIGKIDSRSVVPWQGCHNLSSIEIDEITGVPNPRHRTGIALMPKCDWISIHSNIFIDICTSKLVNQKAAVSLHTVWRGVPRTQATKDIFNLLLTT